MKFINLFLVVFLSISQTFGQSSSKQSRIIEINNDKGELYLSFEDGEIVEFTINDKAVSPKEYKNYQSYIDEFTQDDLKRTPPTPQAFHTPPISSSSHPTPPTPPSIDSKSEKLLSLITAFLFEENALNSYKKYEIKLKAKYMKVNGEKLTPKLHRECLSIFEDIYGHALNSQSKVQFKRKDSRISNTISIVD